MQTLLHVIPRSTVAKVLLPLLVPLNLLSVPYYLILYSRKALRVSLLGNTILIKVPNGTFDFTGMARGHVVVVTEDGYNQHTLMHELHHVEQTETAGFAGLCVGLLALFLSPWWFAVTIWATLPALMYAAASFIAVCRGGDGYKDNVWEKGAYGVDGRTHEGPPSS